MAIIDFLRSVFGKVKESLGVDGIPCSGSRTMFKETSAAEIDSSMLVHRSYEQVEAALHAIGGHGWEGRTFRDHVLKSLGFDASHPPASDVQADAYNRIAGALNKLNGQKGRVSKRALCADLGITCP